MHKIKISINSLGIGTVEINGRDIARHVKGLSVEAEAGSPTAVRFILAPGELDLEIEAEDVEMVPA